MILLRISWSIVFFLSAACPLMAQHPEPLPTLANRKQPEFENPSFCPPLGTLKDGEDPDLNRLKNRIDDSQKYHFVDINEIRGLVPPTGRIERKRQDWTAEQRSIVEQYEGTPVVVQGYLVPSLSNRTLVAARAQGPESCNCFRSEASHVDFRIWLANDINRSKLESIVAEITPRVRAKHIQWTLANLTHIATMHFPIRVYGWLMFDQRDANQLGKSRVTLWEIHPVVRIQFRENGVWKQL